MHQGRARQLFACAVVSDWLACRVRVFHGLVLLLALLIVQPGLAAGQVSIEPLPDWVMPATTAQAVAVPNGRIQNGVYYLLADVQIRAAEAQKATSYFHFAALATNASGVENVADITIDFNPAFQQLRFHQLNVIRDGQTHSRLETTDIQLLQRERELERRILDGGLTASLVLDDVRVGDIVEYRYSIQGQNPVFDNHTFGSHRLQWGVPLRHDRSRLLIPEGRQVAFAGHNTAIEPQVRERDGWREYYWEQFDVEEVLVEDETPYWYQPYGRIQWSEYPHWNAVAHWALPHYQVPQPASESVQALAAGIAAETADRSEQLARALQFVQSEIRYLSMAIGTGSHRPNPPETVLKRRFGDCKDKSLLLLALLAELGIEARAALVNSELGKGIEHWLPAPNAFDHVLVRARLDGRDYWLDPTRAAQLSPLSQLDQADFGFALIVDEQSQQLVPMSKPAPEQPLQHIHALLDLSAGLDQPAPYTVASVFTGKEAERARAMLASANIRELQQHYLNYYAYYFSSIRSLAELAIEDDLAANRLQITEYYELSEPWYQSPDQQQLEIDIYVPEVLDLLRAPASPRRQAPLAKPFPFALTQVTEVLLDGDNWQLESEHHRVDDPAFTFQRWVQPQRDKLLITDHYRALSDHVPATEMANFIARLKQARDVMSYGLYRFSGTNQAISGSYIAVLASWSSLALVTLMIALAAWLYRYNPLPRQPIRQADLAGIGGWLLLPLLALFAGAVLVGIQLIQDLSAYSLSFWTWIASPASDGYQPGEAGLMLFSLVANTALLVFLLLLLLLFFQRRSSLPRLYISMLIFIVLIRLADLAGHYMLSGGELPGALSRELWIDLRSAIFGVLVWGCYFSASKRVEATFTRRLQKQGDDSLARQSGHTV